MKIKYFILFIILSFPMLQESIVYREFINNGNLNALVNEEQEQLYLVQLDVTNDSLCHLALSALPDLELYAGPSSYHRIMSVNQYNLLSSEITSDYLKVLDPNYQRPNSREYWTQTFQGNEYYNTSGETSNSCMCIDGPNCVVVGYNDSWYNPFDYYGEVTWNFIPPSSDEILEARLYVSGSQCDDLPLWSETNMAVKNNSCNWGDFQVTLSIENTVNGPYIIPDNLLDQIWCDGGLQPVIGSEDNYNVNWIQVELYYICDAPNAPSSIETSNGNFCDYVQINWGSETDISGYKLYRDNNIISTFDINTLEYIDYFAQTGSEHEYCLTMENECGESEPICSIGSKKENPNSTDEIVASDNNPNEIQINWTITNNTSYYNLYRDNYLLSVMSVDVLDYIDIFVESDNEYEYCIESVNECGNSEWNCDTGSLSVGNVGDVNLDGLIDILDIIIILNFVLELETPNSNELWLSDINYDGDINILDIVFLVNVVLSIPNN